MGGVFCLVLLKGKKKGIKTDETYCFDELGCEIFLKSELATAEVSMDRAIAGQEEERRPSECQMRGGEVPLQPTVEIQTHTNTDTQTHARFRRERESEKGHAHTQNRRAHRDL